MLQAVLETDLGERFGRPLARVPNGLQLER